MTARHEIDLTATPSRRRSPRVAIVFLPVTLGVLLVGWVGWELCVALARTLTRRLLACEALVCGGWFVFLFWAHQISYPGVRRSFWQMTGYTESAGRHLLFTLGHFLPIDSWPDAWSGWFREGLREMTLRITWSQMLGALLPMALLFALAFVIQACRQLRAALNPNPEARP